MRKDTLFKKFICLLVAIVIVTGNTMACFSMSGNYPETIYAAENGETGNEEPAEMPETENEVSSEINEDIQEDISVESAVDLPAEEEAVSSEEYEAEELPEENAENNEEVSEEESVIEPEDEQDIVEEDTEENISGESPDEETDIEEGETADSQIEIPKTDKEGEAPDEYQEMESLSVESEAESVISETEEPDAEVITLTAQSKSYKVTLTDRLGALEDGTRLSVQEIKKGSDPDSYASYKSDAADMLGVKTDEVSYIKLLDISLIDADGEKVQPSDSVEVVISVLDKTAADKEAQVIHFGKKAEIIESVTEGSDKGCDVSFTTASFSVYAVVEAPEPEVPDPEHVEGVDGLEEDQAYYFSIERTAGTPEYFTNAMNADGCYIITNSISSASPWYLESSSDPEGSYYIYTYVDGVKKYMKNDGGGNKMTLADIGTSYTISEAGDGTFYFKSAKESKWLQYSNGGKGIRRYTDNKNAANCKITITDAVTASISDDPYHLDGTTFGIAYTDASTTSAAVTAEASGAGLRGEDVVLRPDVLDNSGHMFVSSDTDLTEWTFENVSSDSYYIKTTVGGEEKYLSINGGTVTLEDSPTSNSVITVTPGTGSYAGHYRFTVGRYALSLSGKKGERVFSGSSANNGATYLDLVEKSVLTEEDFTWHSAKKVSVSDTVNVHDGSEVILYTRLWNESAGKYEFYAVDHNGTLIPCADAGDSIAWIGSRINSARWIFTEYTDEDTGEPNYYYELQNASYGEYIAPQLKNSQALSDGTIGVNMNGRRYGENSSTIIAWDDTYYQYVGLKVEGGRVVPCPMAESIPFYFAVMAPEEEEDGHLTTVPTVDNNLFGVTMKMIDFNNGQSSDKGRDLVQDGFFGGSNGIAGGNGTGLLSNSLGSDGYPVTVASQTGHEASLKELFNDMTTVNHLFIESVYNESGYFEYDSTQNFATLIQEDGSVGTDFTVYDQLAAIGNNTKNTRTHGQFMPYNTVTEGVFSEVTNMTNVLGEELSDTDPRKGEKLYLISQDDADYFFGMEMEAGFFQTPSGLDAWDHDIVFEFSGDDDFWFYVDGELILDLGGVHSAWTGSINFRTGEVKNKSGTTSLYAIFKGNYESRNPGASAAEVNEYLDGIFELSDEGNYVFKDYSPHTMKMFYMERGAGASNLHMRFNMTSIKPGRVLLSKKVTGTDRDDWKLAEYPYQIYYELDGEDGYELLTQEMLDNAFSVSYHNTSIPVKSAASYTTPDGTTYEHVFFLTPGQTAEIKVPDDTISYYIVECGISPDLYDEVSVNGDEAIGTDNGNGRYDYAMAETTVEETPKVEFENHVDEDALRTLSVKKVLHDEDGDVITSEDDGTLFGFRVSIGGENDEEPQLCNMAPYCVKDPSGHYCVRDGANDRFVSLGKTSYDDLTEAEKDDATFYTSPYGSVSKIPAGYSVEMRDILVGTKFKVEERANEVPEGYRLIGYERVDGSYIAEEGEAFNAGIVRDNSNPYVEVHNKRGVGLTVKKVWSDANYMESHDNIYFALYIGNTMVPGTLRMMKTEVTETNRRPETSLYYYFDELPGGASIGDLSFKEVIVTGAEIGEDGYVTSYTSIQPLEAGDTLTIGGKENGEEYKVGAFTYGVSYERGTPSGDAGNRRTDTVINGRSGIRIVKTDWDGNPLSGGRFVLSDDSGNAAGSEYYEADGNGLITTAYLQKEKTYTLTETASPDGYIGNDALTITVREDGTIETGGIPASLYSVDESGPAPTITIKNQEVHFTVFKEDGDSGSALEGVHFAIHRQVGGRKDYLPYAGYADLVTGKDGRIPSDLSALPSGTYYLVETQTLAGYTLPGDDIIFTVSPDGKVSINSAQHVTYLSSDTEAGEVDYLLTVPNSTSADIAVEKVIAGNMGNRQDIFNISLSDVTCKGKALTGTYPYTVYEYRPIVGYTAVKTGIMTMDGTSAAFAEEGGEAQSSIPLGHKDRLVITGLPQGTSFTASETGDDTYQTSLKVNNYEGNVEYFDGSSPTSAAAAAGVTVSAANGNKTAAVGRITNNGAEVIFINTKSAAIPTVADGGVSFLIVLLIAAAGYVWMRVKKKRSRARDI